jgi:hypothetical protein
MPIPKGESGNWLKDHEQYLKNQQSFRKYGGIPDSTGKVHDLKAKGKALERKINSPKAKAKRALRGDIYEGHSNRFVERELGRLNHKK